MPLIADPRYTGATIGAATRDLYLKPQAQQDDPSTLEVLASGARQSTLSGALYERIADADPDIDTPENYNPLDDIQGFEEHANEFIGADSRSDVQGIKSRIQSRKSDLDVLRRAGLGGTVTEFVMNATDPSFLVSIAVPELAGAKLMQARSLLMGAMEGVAGAGAYEAGMQALQEDRTALESALNISGGAIIGGALGKLQSRSTGRELEQLRKAVDDTLLDQIRSEVGAASSQAPTTLEQEAPAAGVGGLMKAASIIPGTKTDLQIVNESGSLRAQQVLEELAEVPILKQKNTQGIPTRSDSVESRTIQTDTQVANIQDQLNTAYLTYRARGGKMKPKEFAAEVAKASRREDKSSIPEIEPVARALREIFDKPADEAKRLGMLEDPVKAAQEKATERAVDEFVKVESGQIYGDYEAKALSAQVNKRKFAKMARNQVSQDAEELIPEIQDAGNAIRDLAAQRAIKAQQGESIATLNKAAARRKHQEIIDAAYAGYLKRTSPLSRRKFDARAEKARATPDTNEDVNRMAKLLGDQERGALKSKVKAKTVNEEVAGRPLGAASYFRRMYDREAIRKARATWDDVLLRHFTKDGADPLEARAAAEDVTRQILGFDVGRSNWNVKVSVPDAGPLQARTLDIPDAAIEQFLINDPVKVAKSYLRDLVPQIEITKRFGEKDMKSSLEEVAHEYDALREQLRGKIEDKEQLSARLAKLDDKEKRTIEALIRVRDRILGKATRPPESEGGKAFVAGVRVWRNLVAASKLGGTALVSVPTDLARIAAQYGFAPTMSKLVKLTASPAFRSLAKSQARRTGAAVEVALARRVQDAFDGAHSEGWSQNLAQGVYKYTGLNHWTDFSRTLSGTLLEDRVIKSAIALSEGGHVDKFALTRLAQLGLGENELRAISKEVKVHGGELDGTHTSGSANWTDGNLAQIYDAAILKESRQLVLQPGTANRVWWMDSEIGKVIGQLKTFSLASANSYSGSIAASLGQKQYLHAAKFIGFMMMGGYLAHSLRQLAAGFKPETDPAKAAKEAISESGLLGVLPDVMSPMGRLITRAAVNSGTIDADNPVADLFGESARYSDRNPASAIGGPAVGAAFDTWDVMFNRLDNGLTAKDLHAIRRLLPYQNFWYLRRFINALEGESADALGLEGATGDSFGERITNTEEFRKSQ